MGWSRPSRVDPELETIRPLGFEHEKRYLTEWRDQGKGVLTIDPDGYDVEAGETLRLAASRVRLVAGVSNGGRLI